MLREEDMDAWDKLDELLAERFGEADGETALTGMTGEGTQIVITFADLRQIIREGHPDN